MRVLVFKDRCNRVIQIGLNDEGTCATAFHCDQQVGELRLESHDHGNAASATLLDLNVEPAYRRSGIAHTLLAFTCCGSGQPIGVDPDMLSSSPAFQTLFRHLTLEGLLVPI